MKEFLMLGFRKIEGNSILEFEKKFKMDPLELYKKEIDKLIKENLIEIVNDKVRLTLKGLDLANLVFEEFV